MSNWYQDVRAFHEKYGCYIGKRPEFPPSNITALRKELFLEECKELAEAMEARDIVKTADAIADFIYVIIGWSVSLGIPLDKVWDEVQRTNMLKEGGGMREDGKILKPEGWQPPKIEEALFKCLNCRDLGVIQTQVLKIGFGHGPNCTGDGCGPDCPVPIQVVDLDQEPCGCGQAHGSS